MLKKMCYNKKKKVIINKPSPKRKSKCILCMTSQKSNQTLLTRELPNIIYYYYQCDIEFFNRYFKNRHIKSEQA